MTQKKQPREETEYRKQNGIGFHAPAWGTWNLRYANQTR